MDERSPVARASSSNAGQPVLRGVDVVGVLQQRRVAGVGAIGESPRRMRALDVDRSREQFVVEPATGPKPRAGQLRERARQNHRVWIVLRDEQVDGPLRGGFGKVDVVRDTPRGSASASANTSGSSAASAMATCSLALGVRPTRYLGGDLGEPDAPARTLCSRCRRRDGLRLRLPRARAVTGPQLRIGEPIEPGRTQRDVGRVFQRQLRKTNGNIRDAGGERRGDADVEIRCERGLRLTRRQCGVAHPLDGVVGCGGEPRVQLSTARGR